MRGAAIFAILLASAGAWFAVEHEAYGLAAYLTLNAIGIVGDEICHAIKGTK